MWPVILSEAKEPIQPAVPPAMQGVLTMLRILLDTEMP
jgi:hypothetical protein